MSPGLVRRAPGRDRRTDRRTDRIAIANTAEARKNVCVLLRDESSLMKNFALRRLDPGFSLQRDNTFFQILHVDSGGLASGPPLSATSGAPSVSSNLIT